MKEYILDIVGLYVAVALLFQLSYIRYQRRQAKHERDWWQWEAAFWSQMMSRGGEVRENYIPQGTYITNENLSPQLQYTQDALTEYKTKYDELVAVGR